MNLRYEQSGSRAIVYDADCVDRPGSHLFDPAYWRQQDAVVGEAVGRGSALFLETAYGPAVLRTYLRGGWAARVTPDRYLFTGFGRSRPCREARMLEFLFDAGLPVPRPLAAITVRSGMCYVGALLTRRIEGALPLADRVAGEHLPDGVWAECGRAIRRLHDTGVVHADLNARNILVGGQGGVHLIDFDRARRTQVTARQARSNLDRLRRSLAKQVAAGELSEIGSGWSRLEAAYREHGGAA